jgi:hypothetical protein
VHRRATRRPTGSWSLLLPPSGQESLNVLPPVSIIDEVEHTAVGWSPNDSSRTIRASRRREMPGDLRVSE